MWQERFDLLQQIYVEELNYMAKNGFVLKAFPIFDMFLSMDEDSKISTSFTD